MLVEEGLSASVLCVLQARVAGDAAASTAHVPIAFDHHRVVVDLQLRRPDGTLRTARAWVDLWGSELAMTDELASDLGIGRSGADGRTFLVDAPEEVWLGPTRLRLPAVRARVFTGIRWFVPGLRVDLRLPLPAFRDYQVVLDYPGRRLIVADPGSLPHSGTRVPCAFDPVTGLGHVKVRIGSSRYRFALDGGPGVVVSERLVADLATAHPEWPARTGAVGSSNVWGMSGEERWRMLRLPELRVGRVRLRGPAVSGLPGFGQIYPAHADLGIDGLLGGTFLRAFRVEVDWTGGAVHLKRGDRPVADDLDLVDLTLRSDDDGGASILGVGPDVQQALESTSVRGPNWFAPAIRAGDRLLAVNGHDLRGDGMGSAVDALRGAPGAIRTLLVERQGLVFTVRAPVRRLLLPVPRQPRRSPAAWLRRLAPGRLARVAGFGARRPVVLGLGSEARIARI